MNKSKDIIIFSASKAFTEISYKIIDERQLHDLIDVIEVTGKAIIDIAQKASEKGAKVFIARGRNVTLLRENISVPIINVQYTYEDIYNTITKANCIYENIALVGFDEAYDMMVKFREISGFNVQVIGPKTVDNIEYDISNSLKHNTEVLIGGISVKRVADLYKLNHIMLDVDINSLKIAVNSALNILSTNYERDKHLQTILTTINGITEAIINFNNNGEIIFLNDLAKKIFKEHKEDEVRKALVPSVEENSIFSKGTPIFDKVLSINDKNYIVNLKPVIYKNEVQSVIAIIYNANSIQEGEKQLRLKFSTKGYTAKNTFSNIIGQSEILKDTVIKAKKYSGTSNAILITGETGTGKEMFAQSIHNSSTRHNEPFVAINCAALPDSILESELFGYAKGAFTGANKEGKMGIFELAHNGTVFLDEIGEMNFNIQAKILRVLQEKEISRLGDNKVIPIDVRIISATNKNLLSLIKEKKFREDLYYRLAVLELNIPPLDQRLDDIPYLVDYYLNKNDYNVTFSDEAIQLLCSGKYNGNIRELFNILERVIVLSESNNISENDLINIVDVKNFDFTPIEDNSLKGSNNDYEKNKIIGVLEKNYGNRKNTAEELNISLTTLWRKIKKYNINY
jgi:transcriptional regulator with PAS, ATPase and Fis domain